jgi:hypothetical protein
VDEPAHSYHRVIRGVPLWLILEYLKELGGREESPGVITGEGWKANLHQMEDFQIGSIRVGQVKIHLTANAEIFENIQATLDKKLLRAGG